MDRLPRAFAACGLGLMLAAAPGCKLTRPEVPPGRPYANDGRQRPAIEFSSDGHPVNGSANANAMPNTAPGGSNLAAGIDAGISRPNPSAYGLPPAGYGSPNSSGLGQPTVPSNEAPRGLDPAAMPANLPPAGAQAPTIPDLSVPQARVVEPPPNQVIQPSVDTPGRMGAPDQMPSPN